MEFKNSVSTNRVQYLRLCSLGLKKETADMSGCIFGGEQVFGSVSKHERKNPQLYENDKDWPAWSLGRLIEMCPKTIWMKNNEYTFLIDGEGCCGYYDDVDYEGMYIYFDRGDIFDNMILCIEWLINAGKFNKEYLMDCGYDYSLCVMDYEKKLIEDGSIRNMINGK